MARDQEPDLPRLIGSKRPVDAKDDQEEDEKAELDEEHRKMAAASYRTFFRLLIASIQCTARSFVNTSAPAVFRWSQSRR